MPDFLKATRIKALLGILALSLLAGCGTQTNKWEAINADCELLLDDLCIPRVLERGSANFDVLVSSGNHSTNYLIEEIGGDRDARQYLVVKGFGRDENPDPSICDRDINICALKRRNITVQHVSESGAISTIYYSIYESDSIEVERRLLTCQQIRSGGLGCTDISYKCYTLGFSKICNDEPSEASLAVKSFRRVLAGSR